MQLLDEHDKPMRLRDLSPLVRDNQDGLFNQKQLDVAISERLRMLHADGLVRSCGRHTGWTVVRPGAKEEPAPTASSAEEIRERILEGLRRGPKTRVDLLASLPGVSIDWFRQVFDELVERGSIKRLEQGGQFRYAIMPKTNGTPVQQPLGVEVDVDKRAEAVFECLARSDTPLKVTELYGRCTRDGSTMYEHYKQALDRLEAQGMVTIRNGTVYVADEVPPAKKADEPPPPPAEHEKSEAEVEKEIRRDTLKVLRGGERFKGSEIGKWLQRHYPERDALVECVLGSLIAEGAITLHRDNTISLTVQPAASAPPSPPIHEAPKPIPSVAKEMVHIVMNVMMNENLSDRGVLDLRRVVRVLSGQE